MINLTGAETAPNIVEIYVLDDHIKVKLEVYVGDLKKFKELIPDEWLKNSSNNSTSASNSSDELIRNRPSLEQRIKIFAAERLQFVTEKGVKLQAKLKLVELRTRVDRLSLFSGMINPTTRQRVKAAPEDKRVLYAEIIYPFPGKDKISRPEQLTIIPPLNDQGDATANIGFLAYHKAVPIIDFRYLGQLVTLNLDWQDPWYTKFSNKILSRHHKYPLMLYLYVEPRQIRFESLLRISEIATITGFDVEQRTLSVEQKHKLLQEHIINYYTQNETLQIDGESFKPDSVRVEFLHATLSGLKVLENSTAVDDSWLLVGVSQLYYITALPQKIEKHWQYFSQRVDVIPVTVTDPVGPFRSVINKDDPGFGWQNFLKKYSDPVIQPVTVETGWSANIPYIGETQIISWMPEQQEALMIVADVLENVRIAFIEQEPHRFSEALGQTVRSKNIDITKGELGKLFSPKVTGGAVGAVQVFKDLKISNMRELVDPDGFSTTISGSAIIKAQHWGHIDQRQIQFQLLLDLIEDKNQWRLADLTIIDLKEIK